MTKICKNDFHVHSHYSPCADKDNSYPNQILKYAEKTFMKTIGFTDHFAEYPPYATPKWANSGPEIITALRKEIECLSSPVRVLIGCEADVIAGNTLSISPEYAKELDYVVVSASHFHLPGIPKPVSGNILSTALHFINTMQTALNFDFVSTIVHPFKTLGDILGPIEEYMSMIPDRELYLVAEMAYKQKIAMEINSILARDPAYLYSIKRFLQICREVGVRFTYGSDAHRYMDVGYCIGMEDVFNYLELDQKQFLKADELISRKWQ